MIKGEGASAQTHRDHNCSFSARDEKPFFQIILAARKLSGK